ncbi:hypothetical protein PoB_000295200 [Plakobranchus ocellatus]|uniref:Uncharacterized protein n=1 Tax=Plakobranchus ocellatus TaxID=259542 RepID=A0AAV3Y306_9GAST|nr:hypothetical protein PoB_000295200 [Plakobranchus ocellatus]
MHVPGFSSSPRSSGLPVTRNMPFSSASVPHRSRNMTGIYLGLEGNSKPPRSKSAIPPLARGRGMSSRIRTPAEDRRYKMVEYLRIKEEKRGFTGGALRGCKSASAAGQDPGSRDQFRESPPNQQTAASMSKRRWGPGKRLDPSNVDDLIRPNPRNFTTVANSGVTRSEKLIGWMPMTYDLYSLVPADNVTDEVVEEVQKIASNSEELAGLEDCYKRICKKVTSAHISLQSSSAMWLMFKTIEKFIFAFHFHPDRRRF